MAHIFLNVFCERFTFWSFIWRLRNWTSALFFRREAHMFLHHSIRLLWLCCRVAGKNLSSVFVRPSIRLSAVIFSILLIMIMDCISFCYTNQTKFAYFANNSKFEIKAFMHVLPLVSKANEWKREWVTDWLTQNLHTGDVVLLNIERK